MKDGKIQYQGKLSEVKKQEPDLYESWRKALREAKASESRSELCLQIGVISKVVKLKFR